MKVYYSLYQFTPKRAPNRLENASPMGGVYLKVDVRRGSSFTDYFPHTALGDKSIEEFLDNFKFQEDVYSKKCFEFLLNDNALNFKVRSHPKAFLNHTLYSRESSLEADIYKYKLSDESDYGFLPLLKKGKRVRLDANGLFTPATLSKFVSEIPKAYLPQIEYLEDPMHENWPKAFPLKFAQDFIANENHQVLIYKANRSFYSKSDLPIIYSSYMGSLLGQWQCYCDFWLHGDSSLVHGIHVDNFYQKEIFKKDQKQSYRPIDSEVKRIYDELSLTSWKSLCSI